MYPLPSSPPKPPGPHAPWPAEGALPGAGVNPDLALQAHATGLLVSEYLMTNVRLQLVPLLNVCLCMTFPCICIAYLASWSNETPLSIGCDDHSLNVQVFGGLTLRFTGNYTQRRQELTRLGERFGARVGDGLPATHLVACAYTDQVGEHYLTHTGASDSQGARGQDC